jgi:hypothetical protein
MSINPVHGPGADSGTQSADANPRLQRPQAAPAPFDARSWEPLPNSERLQKQASQPAESTAGENELPQDVVEVQRDSEITNQVVIKYVDQATGGVILQVPSAEVLNVAHGIVQDLRQAAKPERSSNPGAVEGVEHGH